MGCFSWTFCDTENERLIIGNKGYLIAPDNTVYTEKNYDGYGVFDGFDVYNLVADWNRVFIAQHPEYVIPYSNKRVDEFDWYPVFADLTLTPAQVEKTIRKNKGEDFYYRWIGIELACYDVDNESLPYPIKVCKNEPTDYDDLPPSYSDPNQGFSNEWR